MDAGFVHHQANIITSQLWKPIVANDIIHGILLLIVYHVNIFFIPWHDERVFFSFQAGSGAGAKIGPVIGGAVGLMTWPDMAVYITSARARISTMAKMNFHSNLT
jgi:hypothetical protein